MSAASVTVPASLPVAGLPGLEPEWSRLVDIIDASGEPRRFHVMDSGAADGQVGTLLCVHGNPTWSYLWRRLVAEPPKGWRVVAVDQLGMGWSDRIGEVRRLADRIDDLDRVGRALAVDGPVVTVAHDWGGPVSLGWALAHQDQLAGVVLTNTAVHQPAGSPAPTLIRLARSPGVLATVCRTTPTFVRGTTGLSRPRPPREVRDAFAAPYSTPARRQAVADFVADIPLEDDHPSMPTLQALAADVSTLQVPVLLAWGPNDPVFSDLYLRDLLERMPHADVHRYLGASHLVTEDAPAALEDIRRWVEGLDLGREEEAVPSVPTKASASGPGRRTMGAALTERAADPVSASEPAVVELGDSGNVVTWGQLDRVVRDLAAGLADAGVRRGDRVALLVPPGADLAAAVYACWRIGAVIVVADAGLGVRGLARALRGAWPQHVIAIDRGLVVARALRVGGRRFAAGPMTARRARLLGAEVTLAELADRGRGRVLPEPPGPEDEAAVIFTSGATGPAKGVVYRHRQVEANRDILVRLYAITPQDRLVAAFAPFALYGPAMGIASAVPDMDVTRPATLDARHLADAVAAVDATLVWASPASLRNVAATGDAVDARQRDALARVRLVMSAGAPVSRSVLHAVLRLAPNAEAHTPYGMTEVLPVTDIELVERDAVGEGEGICVGRPVEGVGLSVSALDALGRAEEPPTQAAEVMGEILVSAPWAKDRYDRLWATESASSRGDGWHRSGDVGHLDDAGRLWVEGRLAHVVTTADGAVTPVGVELRVEGADGVESAACVGIGPAGTQVVVVVVVPSEGPGRRGPLADAELAARVRSVAGVDVAAVLVRASLPVDVRHNSKVDRAALARWAGDLLA
ncbi:MAG TPA: alpha/beta fold hydrolase [Candidatus Limnocylindria bacterium]|nr:alpha/beta fold hydrolase [Candidatus Limnocylindria bacterium]